MSEPSDSSGEDPIDDTRRTAEISEAGRTPVADLAGPARVSTADPTQNYERNRDPTRPPDFFARAGADE